MLDNHENSYNESIHGADHDSEDVVRLQKDKLETLKSMRENVNWEVEHERYPFFCRLRDLIYNWNCKLPDLQDIFRPEEIDYFLLESVIDSYDDKSDKGRRFIEFVAHSSYKDMPDENEDGQASLRRTTAVHYAARHEFLSVVNNLFKIYDKFDVNYTDEIGLTHFHVASMSGCENVVEKFLQLGQDPNCLGYIMGDSPLHLTLDKGHKKVAELLLRNGANPNLSNAKGLTPLHIICGREDDCDSVKMLWELCKEKYQPVLINVRDKVGQTPLHHALIRSCKEVSKFLLKNGADPNLPDKEGLTPLHIVCKKECDDGLAKMFFKVNDEMQRTVQIDAVDKLGRTPLQCAVASLLPHVVDVLLDHGADLSSFVFPIERNFGERIDPKENPEDNRENFKFKLTSEALIIATRFENRGYELDRKVATRIMRLLAKYKLFEKSYEPEICWYDDKEFAIQAKQIMINSSLSLYDLIRLQPEEAEKLVTYSDYFEFAHSGKLEPLAEEHRKACDVNLFEQLSSLFFRRWRLNSILELTQ